MPATRVLPEPFEQVRHRERPTCLAAPHLRHLTRGSRIKAPTSRLTAPASRLLTTGSSEMLPGKTFGRSKLRALVECACACRG
jgi:hypothetical protein